MIDVKAKVSLVAAFLLVGSLAVPSTLAHDGDGDGLEICHSPTNDGVEDTCTAIDRAGEELPDRVCTSPIEQSVGPVTVHVDRVCTPS